ncbi:MULTISPECIES: cytochrome P450 [unclassified Saccharopolyspora]|uniref:cytochrome P450 n=1 Tax=unclassified Saccharopolyspora TaxID=2646250 RepID=UPI001CD28AF7|nr:MULTISPECIES: cytochrome P450 [unclassified Saccharopolyspora]MCA1185094.1 cytochrome P450 [Saccharopolyspora sp. 6T]MCA1191426.1 cytochrome P450 [Saccharopolyspora sp. 6V]
MTTAEPRTFPFSRPERLDPEPLFQELREQPLLRVRLPYGEPAWLASRYEDVKVVLGDPRFSRAASVGRDEPRMRPHQGSSGNILSMDPPEHSRLRRLVMKAFTQRRVEQLRPRVQEIADGFVDAMLAAGPPADLVADFALPLPITVICELLGVPYADRGDFRQWSDAFLSTTKFTPGEVAEAIGAMREYMAGLIAERRRDEHGRDDLLSALVAARDEQDRLSEDEMLSLAEAILVAGHETTASQIPNFVHVLLEHPEELARLRAEPDLVPRAVEELLRFVPLGNGAGIARYALEDVELGGVLVRAGEPVLPATASANRDAAVYRNPEQLDLARAEASHVGFGHGPHHCLGAPLARMELQVALDVLLRRLPGLRVTDEAAIEWKDGLSTRGPSAMPISWDAG